jgi:hypothetical protein
MFKKKQYCWELKIIWVDEWFINEKFFSTKRNSCIYKYSNGWYEYLGDALTKEIIVSNQWNIERNTLVDEKLKELK